MGTEVIVTFPSERVLSAVEPFATTAPPLAPQGEAATASAGKITKLRGKSLFRIRA
jgi:hypothetical protein